MLGNESGFLRGGRQVAAAFHRQVSGCYGSLYAGRITNSVVCRQDVIDFFLQIQGLWSSRVATSQFRSEILNDTAPLASSLETIARTAVALSS